LTTHQYSRVRRWLTTGEEIWLYIVDPPEAGAAISAFGDWSLYVEKWVPFVKEVGSILMVVCSTRREV